MGRFATRNLTSGELGTPAGAPVPFSCCLCVNQRRSWAQPTAAPGIAALVPCPLSGAVPGAPPAFPRLPSPQNSRLTMQRPVQVE